MRKVFILAALLPIASVANADFLHSPPTLHLPFIPGANTLASPPVWAGPTQTMVACYLFNASNTNVTVSSAEIFAIDSATPLSALNFCNIDPTLAPNRGCAIFNKTTVDNGHSYACKFTFTGGNNLVRGSIQLMKAGIGGYPDTVLQILPMW